jgi:hypothetical protein
MATRLPIFSQDLSLYQNLESITKSNLSPASTNESDSPRENIKCLYKPSIKVNKEKSQLCKKFV